LTQIDIVPLATPGPADDAAGALVLFDITNRETFDGLERWSEPLAQLPGVLVGTNAERLRDREVPTDEARAFAERYKWDYVEVSARNGVAVCASFKRLAAKVISGRPLTFPPEFDHDAVSSQPRKDPRAFYVCVRVGAVNLTGASREVDLIPRYTVRCRCVLRGRAKPEPLSEEPPEFVFAIPETSRTSGHITLLVFAEGSATEIGFAHCGFDQLPISGKLHLHLRERSPPAYPRDLERIPSIDVDIFLLPNPPLKAPRSAIQRTKGTLALLGGDRNESHRKAREAALKHYQSHVIDVHKGAFALPTPPRAQKPVSPEKMSIPKLKQAISHLESRIRALDAEIEQLSQK
jgi:hypothetical protein